VAIQNAHAYAVEKKNPVIIFSDVDSIYDAGADQLDHCAAHARNWGMIYFFQAKTPVRVPPFIRSTANIKAYYPDDEPNYNHWAKESRLPTAPLRWGYLHLKWNRELFVVDSFFKHIEPWADHGRWNPTPVLNCSCHNPPPPIA